MKDTFKKIIVSILTWEAKLVLKRYKPKIIAVTGSVGKTSTKDAIYTALAPYVHVRRSEKSYNSEMGVPLSILGLPNAWTNPILWTKNLALGLWLAMLPQQYPEWLVLEVGADKPGDIRDIAKWLKPDVVVITRFPDVPVHIEFFESKEHVIQEKTSLAEALKSDGLLVINGDDPLVAKLYGKYGARTVAYGSETLFPVHSENTRFIYSDDAEAIPSGRSWSLVTPEKTFQVTMPHVLGDSHITAALAAFAVVYGLGFELDQAVVALGEYRTPPGRLSLVRGMHGSLVIDDTYNSSPTAAESSIGLLRELKTTGHKIAVLGDMMELGKYSADAHHALGKQIVGACDRLLTVGIRATEIDKGAIEAGFLSEKILHVETAEQAGEALKHAISKGDIILVKGSQSVRLEKAVKMILADAADAQYLVRQEEEWEER